VFMTLRSQNSGDTTEAKPTVTLPKLKKDEITGIEIIKPDKTDLVLTKADNTWNLSAPVAAKADSSAVDSVIEKLTDLEVSDVAATRKENHKRLQVDAETGLHVKVKGGDKVLADLWIGASKTGGTMLRVDGQDVVVAVKGSIRYAFDKEVKMFRDRVVTDIDPKDLSGIAIESAKGKFKFDKPEEKWVQPKGEKPIEHFSDSKVQSVVSTAARLRASDFAPASESVEAAGFNAPTAKVTLFKKDGSNVVVEVGKEVAGSDYFLRVVGNPVVYRISKYTGDRLMPELKAFQEEEKKPGDQAAAPPGMPPGMGGPGGGQIPPELMQQLQQQMAAQGGHP